MEGQAIQALAIITSASFALGLIAGALLNYFNAMTFKHLVINTQPTAGVKPDDPVVTATLQRADKVVAQLETFVNSLKPKGT